jgi:hypothetical protein
MRVTTLHYRRNINLGDYQTEHIELEIVLEEGEQPGEALVRARRFCRKAWGLEPLSAEEEAAARAMML